MASIRLCRSRLALERFPWWAMPILRDYVGWVARTGYVSYRTDGGRRPSYWTVGLGEFESGKLGRLF